MFRTVPTGWQCAPTQSLYYSRPEWGSVHGRPAYPPMALLDIAFQTPDEMVTSILGESLFDQLGAKQTVGPWSQPEINAFLDIIRNEFKTEPIAWKTVSKLLEARGVYRSVSQCRNFHRRRSISNNWEPLPSTMLMKARETYQAKSGLTSKQMGKKTKRIIRENQGSPSSSLKRKKRSWTEHEKQILSETVPKHTNACGKVNWTAVAYNMTKKGVYRSNKQVRERWIIR